MKRIPKSLVPLRDAAADELIRTTDSELDFNHGFSAGVAAVLASEELKGLVVELECFIGEGEIDEVLKRWHKFLGDK